MKCPLLVFLTLPCSPQTQNSAKKSNGRRAVVVFRDAEKSRFLLLHSIIFFALAVYTHTRPNIGARFPFFLFLEGGETKKVDDGISSSFVSLHEALSPRGFQFRALSVLFLFLPPPVAFAPLAFKPYRVFVAGGGDTIRRPALFSYRRVFFVFEEARGAISFSFFLQQRKRNYTHHRRDSGHVCATPACLPRASLKAPFFEGVKHLLHFPLAACIDRKKANKFVLYALGFSPREEE